MKNTENKDIEKIKDLLDAVNVPFSEYKDTYNKMINIKDLVVKMDEDSQESTIVENAILRAAEEGLLDADEAVEFIYGSITAFISNGLIRGLVFKDKKGVVQIVKFNVMFSI